MASLAVAQSTMLEGDIGEVIGTEGDPKALLKALAEPA
jgi:hypothetical protein